VTPSLDQAKRIKAHDINSLLARRVADAREKALAQQAAGAEGDEAMESSAPGWSAPGFPLSNNPFEIERRHQRGLAALRTSTELNLAFGVLEFHANTRDLTQRHAGVTGWYHLIEPVFAKQRSALCGDRQRAIFSFIDELCDLAVEQYALAEVPFSAVLNLAGTTVTAYGIGFLTEP
jgi:hypothetical protein